MNLRAADEGKTPPQSSNHGDPVTNRVPHTVRSHYSLAILSGVLLGCSFPPSSAGILSFIGLIPLLVALEDCDRLRDTLKTGYAAMLVFHVITLNWTGGYVHGHDPYMMIAGALTMIVHPVFYFLPLGAYHAVRKSFGSRIGLIAFPFLWVGYEYSHSLSEWSFPWLTIGNSQSYDLPRIQFIRFTGVYGLSFVILLFNVAGYLLYRSLVGGAFRRERRKIASYAAILAVLYVGPLIDGLCVMPTSMEVSGQGRPVSVGIVQANVDPWDKWNTSGERALSLYLRMTDSLISRPGLPRPEFVLWPETAMPVYLLAPGNKDLLDQLRRNIDSSGVAVLTGLPYAVFYDETARAPASAKRSSLSGRRYDAFNAAAFVQPHDEHIPWYGKMKMVPLAERVPYADALSFLGFMQWGVGIGGWQIGPDTTIFQCDADSVRFATLICYESVYPGFVASFVRKGAELLTIITIDSWWGKMSGAYQHYRFAVFRAVENRRWIARCAVGGISCYIDPFGRTYDQTELFTQSLLSKTVYAVDDKTIYTRYGDWFGASTLAIGGLFVGAVIIERIRQRMRSSR
jgi:apolipoprotein N-acyltransferase